MKRMRLKFVAEKFSEAVDAAFFITAWGKNDLRETFERHCVTILHLDHEAFGIYAGKIEPCYDLRVDAPTSNILAAATEFGRRHAQEAVLIARKLRDGENHPNERIGVTIKLGRPISADEAVRIAVITRNCCLTGATFLPKSGEIVIYNSEDMGMTNGTFKLAIRRLVALLEKTYNSLILDPQWFIMTTSKL